jgi:hypothetical protein
MKILGLVLLAVSLAIIVLVIWSLCKAAPDWEEEMEEDEEDDNDEQT